MMRDTTRSAPMARGKLVVWVSVVVGLVAAAWHFDAPALLRGALDAIVGLGPWGSVIFIVLYIAATVLFLPGSILTLGAGAVFGVVKGAVIVSVSATLGATAAFLVGRYVARDAIARKIEGNPKFKAIDLAVAREGWKIVGLTRLSPVFPFNLLNYAFGLTRVSLRDYVLASWIGMIPGTVMYVYLGSLAGDLASIGSGRASRTPAEWVLYGVGLLATVTVTLYVTRIARGALTRRIDAGHPVREEAMPVGMPELHVVAPWDTHNQALVGRVHPRDWVNPKPAGRYNLVVIGAGTAGLVTAAGAAGLGAKVALIERDYMGGDCLNVGCVPSKGLIRAGRASLDVRDAGAFGVQVPPGARVDFTAVMERVRRLRAKISTTDSAERFRGLGVDVFFGQGRFSGPDAVEVGGQTLRFRKAVVATGARATAPPIPGLAEAGYLTNETVFALTELPRRLAVIGAGPIGCELAQAFARFGSRVYLIEALHGILPNEDREAAEIVHRSMTRDGVTLLCCGGNLTVGKGAEGKRLAVDSHDQHYDVTVDEILVGVGRSPNVEGLGLEQVGVAFDKTGVTVNDRLQTTNPRIYAAGDICSRYKFTHNSDFQARIVIQNALFMGRARASALTIPWCTYTDPEIAHVGLYERDGKERGIPITTFVQGLGDVDRAILDGETEGLVKVHVRAGTDKIVGATIVARHAGEMLPELSLAIVSGVGLGKIANVIHSYPTQAEAIRKLGDAYNRTRLTPLVKKVFGWWLTWTR